MSVRIGFVGAGGIARKHMAALAKIKAATLVCYTDKERARSQSAADRYGGRAYADHRKMLDAEELDAVYVCVPPLARGAIELAICARRLGLFVEKPVALSNAAAEKTLGAIAAAKSINCVGYQWRYSDPVAWAREALKGRTVAAALGWWIAGLTGAPWSRAQKTSGGQNVEQTTHIFDLARFLCGEVCKVYSSYALRCLTDVPELDVHDVGTVTVEFESGAIGNFSNACCVQHGYRVGLAVLSHDLTVDITPEALTVETPNEKRIRKAKSDALREENLAFVRAVEKNDQSLVRSSYEDASCTLAVTLAALKSAKSGKPVTL